jgi:hypothetical protein
MPRINLPPGCAGFADGDRKYMADRPGGHVYLDDTDPVDRDALRKLKNQDYASAGLVDAGPEKFTVVDKKKSGRWCMKCIRSWQGWTKICPKCQSETVAEIDVDWPETPTNVNGVIIL